MNFLERLTKWLQPDNPNAPKSPKAKLSALLAEARRAQYAEDYTQSIALFDQALAIAQAGQQTTLQADVLLNKADALIWQRQFEAATQILEELVQRVRVVELQAPLAYALCSLGVVAQAQAQYDKAQQHYEEAIEVAREAHTLGAEGRGEGHLADTYLTTGNANYAIYLFRNAIQKLESSGDSELIPFFMGRLGQAQFIIGHQEQGRVLLARALEVATAIQHRRTMRFLHTALAQDAINHLNYSAAYPHLQEALALYPDVPTPKYVDLLCQASDVARHLHDQKAALDYARQALEMGGNFDDAAQHTRAQVMLGLALHANDETDAALPVLRMAAHAYDDLPTDAHKILLLRTLAEFDDAPLQRYQQALKAAQGAHLPQEQATIQDAIGRCHAAQHDYEAAIDAWEAALEGYIGQRAEAQTARLYCEIGAVRQRMGQGKRAEKDFEAALLRLSNIEDAETRGIVLFYSAGVMHLQGDVATAEEFYTESIAIAADDEDARAEAERRGAYGLFLARTDRTKLAITELMQGRNRAEEAGLPDWVRRLTDDLGVVYAQLGDYDKALTLHQQALEDAPPDVAPRINAHAAHALLGLGQYDAAESVLLEALDAAREHADLPAQVAALKGIARVHLAHEKLETALKALDEAEYIAHKAYLRHALPDIHIIKSRVYAALDDANHARRSWQAAEKLARILHMPTIEPDWLS